MPLGGVMVFHSAKKKGGDMDREPESEPGRGNPPTPRHKYELPRLTASGEMMKYLNREEWDTAALTGAGRINRRTKKERCQ